MATLAQNVVDDHINKNNELNNTKNNESDTNNNNNNKSEYEKNINELAEYLSKLNPWAKEFIPSSYQFSDQTNNTFINFNNFNNNINNYPIHFFHPPLKNSTDVIFADNRRNVCHTMYKSCAMMMNSWDEKLEFKDGSSELDVWPFLENLSGDFISQAAFGSSYEQGKKIFDLEGEYVKLALLGLLATNYIPGWRFLPTKNNIRAKKIIKEIEDILTRMIESRKAEMEAGENTKDDLLGLLLESNMRQNEDKKCLTTKEVVQECQLFYLAGSETTSSLLVWTLILLSKHPIWQERAREEVLHTFGKDGRPDFDGLNRLKIVTMILNEVLRLYPSVYMLMRKVYKDTQLKELLIPAGTELIMPVCIINRDSRLWGDDVKEFNPERFAEGVYEATKGRSIFFPFSVGPRTCIGKNFSLLEAKLVISMILQRYSLNLAPTYIHAPYAILTIRPQHGANLILSKIDP